MGMQAMWNFSFGQPTVLALEVLFYPVPRLLPPPLVRSHGQSRPFATLRDPPLDHVKEIVQGPVQLPLGSETTEHCSLGSCLMQCLRNIIVEIILAT